MGRLHKVTRWRVMTLARATKVTATMVEGPHIVEIEADYHRIVDGVLYFRNWRGPDQYPELVHVFAPGHWLEVRRI